MKVILVNGSPHDKGCTCTALSEVGAGLSEAGVETEMFQIGVKPVRGCIACRKCKQNPGKCVFGDDPANALIERMSVCDGVVIGSPVYYASANGALVALLDRVFYAGGGLFRGKPGACVVSARRGGTTAALDQLHKYLSISQMPVVTSQYWNMVHGNTPDEVGKDAEGMQTMRILGRNMAWLLKCIEAGKTAGLPFPSPETKANTNFIR
jgi:multimeric flavodoxin WrbA